MQKLYDLYQNTDFHIDKILATANVTHREFRQWCTQQCLPKPSPTPGLALEIRIMDPELSRSQLGIKYNVTHNELQHCLSSAHPVIDQVSMEVMLADELRKQGATELEIIERCGNAYTRPDALAKEVTARLEEGYKGVTLARMYNLSPGRIAQLNQNRKAISPPLTESQRAAICNSKLSAPELAEHFNIAVSTVYRVRQEGATNG